MQEGKKDEGWNGQFRKLRPLLEAIKAGVTLMLYHFRGHPVPFVISTKMPNAKTPFSRLAFLRTRIPRIPICSTDFLVEYPFNSDSMTMIIHMLSGYRS